jgi:hypothetical protein
MEKLEEIKTIAPNKDLIDMTRIILEQNSEILRINAVLIQHFSNPVLYLSADDNEGKIG